MFLKSSIIGILTMVFGVLFLFQNEIIFETRADCETQVITIGDVTVASCNVGAEVAGTGISSYGHYFQRDDWSNFLNDKGEGNADKQGPCPEKFHVPSAIERGNFITARYTENTNKVEYYGNAANGLPYLDFSEKTGAFFTFQNNLLLPFAGMYDDDSPFPTSYGQGTMGNYWSSTPYEKYAYSLGLNIQGVYASSYNDRTMRASIRCFQN